MSAGYDGTIRRWNLETGEEIVTHAGHRGEVRASTWLPDVAALASAGEDGRILVWSPEKTPRELLSLGQPADGLTYAQGHLVTVTRDEGQAVVVPLAGGARLDLDLRRGGERTASVGTEGEGFLVTRNVGGETFAWSLPDGHERGHAPGTGSSGHYWPLVQSCGPDVILCDEARGPEAMSQLQVRSLGSPEAAPRWVRLVADTVTGVACDAERERVFVCTGQGSCEALDLEDGRTLWRVEVPQSFCIALSPAGDFLVLGHDNGDASSILDPATGELLGNLPPCHAGTVRGLSFAADGRLASWGNNNLLHVWRIRRQP